MNLGSSVTVLVPSLLFDLDQLHRIGSDDAVSVFVADRDDGGFFCLEGEGAEADKELVNGRCLALIHEHRTGASRMLNAHRYIAGTVWRSGIRCAHFISA